MALDKPTSNKFDTTVISPVDPGLTYATPQADQSGKYYNSLGAFANIAESAVVNATRVDQALVEAESREAAKELSHELDAFDEAYKLQFDINNTYNKMSKAQTEEEKLSLQAELEGYAERLSQLNTQGMPNPYEFKMRMNAKAADIYHRNPAYAAEISAQMNKIFNIHGVSDKLNILQSGMDAANKRAEDDYKMKVKFLNEKRFIDTTGFDMDDINEAYASEIASERDLLVLQKYTENVSSKTAAEKSAFEQQIKVDGGLHVQTTKIMDNVFNALMLIEEDQGDFKTKDVARRKVISDAKKMVNNVASLLPANENYNNWRANMIAYIDDLDKESQDALVNGRGTTELKNRKDRMATYNQITRIANGTDAETINILKQQSSIIADLSESKFFNDSIAQKALEAQIADTIVNGARQTNLKNPEITDWLKQEASKSSYQWSQTAAQELKIKGQLNDFTAKTLNNMWLEARQFQDPYSLQRYEAGDKVIGNMLRIDDKVWNYMMDNHSDFRNSANDELLIFGNTSANLLVNPTNGLLWEETSVRNYQGVEINETTGRVSYSSNQTIDRIMNRINKYISLKAKIDGTTFKQASDTVFGPNGKFNFLTKEGFDNLSKYKDEIGHWDIIQ
jgi:hypothetical protein